MLNILVLSSDNNNQLITFIFAWSFTVWITAEGLICRDNICVSTNSNNSHIYKAILSQWLKADSQFFPWDTSRMTAFLTAVCQETVFLAPRPHT